MWFVLLLIALPAWAQPACSPRREGQVVCFAGRLCACRFETGGSLTGRPSAHRWDCGVLRPDCQAAPLAHAPVELPDLLLQLPGKPHHPGFHAAPRRR